MNGFFDGFTLTTARVRDGELRLRHGGSGPPLLLLHGNPQTHAMWHAVAPVLARRYTVICPDLRGYGGSFKPAASQDHAAYAKSSMARDMAELMTLLGHDRFQVVSHNRGARVVHRLAIDNPERVQKLAVMDIVPTIEHFERTDMAFALGYYHWFWFAQPHPFPEEIINAAPDVWFRAHTSREPKLPGFFREEALRDYLAAAHDPEAIIGMCEDYRAAATIDLQHDRISRAEGRKVQCPMLALWGAKGKIGGWYDPVALWREYCSAEVSGAAVDSGHYLAEEAPGEVLAHLEMGWTAPAAPMCQTAGRETPAGKEPPTMSIAMIGLDTAKSMFQVHAVDEGGKAEIKRKLRRSELVSFFEKQAACTVVMEACGAAHHWARMLTGLGHSVKLIAPEAVRPFVKQGKKNDAADAAAICEAASRPDVKFVPAKSLEQQGILALHSARSLLVKQQTMLANAMRGLAAEFGLTVPLGTDKLEELMALVEADEAVPKGARQAVRGLLDHRQALAESAKGFEAAIVAHARQDETARRLATVPGIGPITASLIAATVADIGVFQSARHFAAWLGLVPRQHSTGGKTRLGRITKTGNREIRRLLVLGATSMVHRVAGWNSAAGIWARGLLGRRPVRLVTVALANKMARIAWAVMTRKEVYHAKGRVAAAAVA